MNDLEYRYFYEVAMTLNFSQAAERLFISQPALSRCISNLEEEFHAPLFVRNKRGVHLTSAGVALLHNYPQVQQANRILQETVQNAACGMDSRLVIGIQEGHLITASIKQALKDFRIHNPSIEINVVSLVYNQLFDQLNSHKIDLAFSLDFPNNIYPNIERKHLAEKQSYALVSRDHPAAKCKDPAEGLKILDGMDLMLVEWSIVPNVTSWIIDQCVANGFSPANIHYAPSYLTLYNWLIMEKGFVIMNKEPIFNESYIHYIPLLKEKAVDFCVYRHKEATNPATLKLIESLPACLEL